MPRKKAKPGKEASPWQVFVSHATADKWIAMALCDKIEKLGCTTFRDDRDIQGGDDIPDEILKQLRRSGEVLLLLTPHSVDRAWVLLEAGAAWSMKKRIVVIRCHVEIDAIPGIMKSRKAFDLNEFGRYLEELEGRWAKR